MREGKSVSEQRDLTRRSFIKRSAGVMAFVAFLASPLAPVLSRARASESPDSAGGGEKENRAWCMVIDLKKCDGCVTRGISPQCVQACILGHFAPKGQQWIEVYELELPGGGSFFLPAPCYQCENAPCVNVCPVGATYHTEDGVVLVDHDRCIGCRLCMAACPYQRRFFNWGTPELPPEAASAEYSPLYPVPAVKGTVIKCMFCLHFLHDGRLPYCVSGCPTRALYMGDLNADVASNGAEVVELGRFLDANDAFRYKEELGTQPRVYYLPGHGQASGRKPDDPRELIQPEWTWGGEGNDRKIGIWPWGEDS
jgi:molybdopterin-containing oxidoreductase family iron-sulfur binding subunit